MARRQGLRKKYSCGYCPYATDEIPTLDIHIDKNHECKLCGIGAVEIKKHYCTFSEKEDEYQMGRGFTLQMPLDAQGKPVFKLVASSFKDTIVSFDHRYKNDFADIEEGTSFLLRPLTRLVKQYVQFHSGIRFKLSYEIIFFSPKEDKNVQKRYSSVPFTITHPNFTEDKIMSAADYVEAICNILSHEVSGLIIKRMVRMIIVIMLYRPVLAESYIPISSHLQNRQGLINVRNVDNARCLSYAVACSVYHPFILSDQGNNIYVAKGAERKAVKRKLERSSTYDRYVEEMQLKDGTYGSDLSEVDRYECLNEISVSIVKYSRKQQAVVPVRLTKVWKDKHAFLLMISKNHLPKETRKKYAANLHFVSIISISAFMGAKKKNYRGVCRFCFSFYRSIDHERQCYQNDFSSITVPKDKFYKYTELHRLCVPHTWFCYQLLFDGAQDNIKICGFTLLGFNADFENIYSFTYTGEDSTARFFDALLVNATYHYREHKENQISLHKTAESIAEQKKVKNCYLCGKEVSKSNPTVSHHDHYGRLINGDCVEGLTSGSVRSFPCNECNLKIQHKRFIPVYSFSLSYHIPFFLAHIAENNTADIHLTPMRSADTYASLKLNNRLVFIDMGNHFNNETLYSIMKSVDDCDVHLLSKLARDEKEFYLRKRGMPFPCFAEGLMPSFENFTDVRSLKDEFTFDDYNNVQELYKYLNCSSLSEYAHKSLENDTFGMASIIINYCKFCLKNFSGLMPLYDSTISQFAYAAMHFINRSCYENLTDARIIKILESSMLCGVSISNTRKVDFQSSRLGDWCVPEKSKECLFIDYKAQFATIMLGPMPCGEYRLWSPDEVKEFDLNVAEKTENYCYLVCCSLKYPQTLHNQTASFPLCFNRKPWTENNETKYGSSENNFRVDLSQYDKENIWLSLKLLKLFLDLGIELVSIHQIISYRVSNHLAEFAKLCLEGRLNSTNSFYSRIFKILPTLAIGKTSQKRDNIRISLPKNRKRAIKLLSKTSFCDAIPIAEQLALVYMKRSKSLTSRNIFIAYHTWMESCFLLYEMFYRHIRGVWGDKAQMMYANTDSAIISIDNPIDYYAELNTLSKHLDFSTVPKQVYFYNPSHKYEFGKWKFEAFYVKQFLSARQKSYSILQICDTCKHSDHEECNSCTICKGTRKGKISHQKYHDVVTRKQFGVYFYRRIQHNTGGKMTLNTFSRTIGLSNGNRVWTDENSSLPPGHFSLDQ